MRPWLPLLTLTTLAAGMKPARWEPGLDFQSCRRWLVLRTLRDHPGIGRGWTAPALPADLPDLSKPSHPSLTPEQRRAAQLAYYCQIYEAMLKPPPEVKTEFNAGILLNIIETFPGTPDAAKAQTLWDECMNRKKKGKKKDLDDSDHDPEGAR
jgi:hypothetical protein